MYIFYWMLNILAIVVLPITRKGAELHVTTGSREVYKNEFKYKSIWKVKKTVTRRCKTKYDVHLTVKVETEHFLGYHSILCEHEYFGLLSISSSKNFLDCSSCPRLADLARTHKPIAICVHRKRFDPKWVAIEKPSIKQLVNSSIG